VARIVKKISLFPSPFPLRLDPGYGSDSLPSRQFSAIPPFALCFEISFLTWITICVYLVPLTTAPRNRAASLAIKQPLFLRLKAANRSAKLSPFRINTCKSVSKQRTLTAFRINTYEKQVEGGYPHRGYGPGTSLT
jgi:hypothetical protein